MYEIEMQQMSAEFFACWQAAGLHLSKQVDGGLQTWLRAHPHPPFLEHLSFRLGNQLFFVRIEDVDGKVHGPGTPKGLIMAAEGANGHACLMPMKKNLLDGSWEADRPGWGLLDIKDLKPIDPVSLVTDQKIEMTSWEVHDMAVQVVRGYLKKEGFEMMSWQGNPEVDPSIWFVGKTKGPEWVVVRSVKYPAKTADRPEKWQDIAASCARMSTVGHFASVAIVSSDQPFESADEEPVPLWRGHGMYVRFEGLE